MLTPRGRSVLALAVGSLVFGRILALRELHMIAGGLFTLLAIGLATVMYRRLQLRVRRRVVPARTHAPGEARVELTLTNAGAISGGPILLEDALPSKLTSSARLSVASIAPHASRTAAYVLRPKTRGFYRLGPVKIALTDAFGLFLRRQEVAGMSNLVVYPSFEPIRSLPQVVQRAGAVRRSPLLGQGDEFYALRSYEEGDDLRKVHWPTSMKLGEPYVKQEELLLEPGALVVLDTCASKHRGDGPDASVEAAISAAASVGTLALRSGLSLDMFTSDGALVRGRRPSEDELLEALALLEPSPRDDILAALTAAARRRAPYTSLVVISPGLADAELAMLARLAARTTGGAIVQILAETFVRGSQTAAPRLAKVGLPVVTLSARDSFEQAWEGGVKRVALAR